LEQDTHQLAVDLRPDRHGIERLGGADAVEIDWNVGQLGGCREHRDRRFAGAAAALAEGLAVLLRLHQEYHDPGDSSDAEDREQVFEKFLHFRSSVPFTGSLSRTPTESSSGVAGQPPPKAWYRLTIARNLARRTVASVSSAWNRVCCVLSRVMR